MTVAEAVDFEYLQALLRAGPNGFAPIGWLYSGLMQDLANRGLAYFRGSGYVLTDFGKEELERLRAQKAAKIEEPPLGTFELRDLALAVRRRLNNIAEELEKFERSPQYDEDYKLARYPWLTREAFAKLNTLVDALEREFNTGIGSSVTQVE